MSFLSSTGSGGVQYTETYGRDVQKVEGAAVVTSKSSIPAVGTRPTKTNVVPNKKASKENKTESNPPPQPSHHAEPLKEKNSLPNKSNAATAGAPPGKIAKNPSQAEPNARAFAGVVEDLKFENDRLRNEKRELKDDIVRIEKERDFYFEKLREIEMMLQDLEDNGGGNELTMNIFKILYATTDGFETNGENDNNASSLAGGEEPQTLAEQGPREEEAEETY